MKRNSYQPIRKPDISPTQLHWAGEKPPIIGCKSAVPQLGFWVHVRPVHLVLALPGARHLAFQGRPGPSFFRSKEELLKVVAVLAIASAVSVSCNIFPSVANPITKPSCDSDVDSADSFLFPLVSIL